MTYSERVEQLELEGDGMSTSDAQGIADAEIMRGRVFDFDSEYPLDNQKQESSMMTAHELALAIERRRDALRQLGRHAESATFAEVHKFVLREINEHETQSGVSWTENSNRIAELERANAALREALESLIAACCDAARAALKGAA